MKNCSCGEVIYQTQSRPFQMLKNTLISSDILDEQDVKL